MSESDGDIANELVEFEEMNGNPNDEVYNPDYSPKRNPDKKKSMPTITKNHLIKYVRRHSPLRLKNNHSNETYIMDKPSEVYPEPQGFLSIVRINTKNQLDSSGQADNSRKVSITREDKASNEDRVLELGEFRESQKENAIRKTRKLITEKEMIKEKMREGRRRVEEGMVHSKTTNGFFRYNYIRKH